MKTLFFVSVFVLMAIAVQFVGISLIHAQDPTAEPTIAPTIEPTAEPTPPEPPGEPTPPDLGDLINGVTGLIVAFAGLLGSALTNIIRNATGLSNENQNKLISAVNEILAVAVNVVTGFIVALITQSIGLVGGSSLQTLAIALATPLVAEGKYRLAKFSAKG